MTTAAAMTAAPFGLSFVTAETAFAAYELACRTGAPESFETASHALAAALRGERARRMAPRPPSGARAVRLVVDNDPGSSGQSAPPRARSKGKAAPALDMDAPLPRTKRGAPSGSFVVEWSDGTETRVQGVPWVAAKADQRWTRAYQAANRVRRLRHGRVLESEMGGAAAIAGRYQRTSTGVMRDSDVWLEYRAVAPLGALAAIVDETTGERWTAPEGSAFGGGDADRAAALGASLTLPRLPWMRAEAARSAVWVNECPNGISYATEGGVACVMTPWPANMRAAAIADAVAAFSPEPEFSPAPAPAVAGERIGSARPEALAGVRVTAEASAVTAATEAADAMSDEFQRATTKTDRTRFLKAEQRLRDLAATLAALIGKAWTVRRGPGGVAVLERPGEGAVMGADGLGLLSYAV